jgi:NADPH:quinone reductase-like Zn-dependent oxidoreductase
LSVRAAVVRSFNRPPRCEDFPAPHAEDDELLIDVIAAGLHPRVRSQANGSHYTSGDELPLVPGIDGVGRDQEGMLRYFVLPDTTMGAMAEQTVVDRRRSVPLPEDTDPILVAAAMNPAMSSWVALRRRIIMTPGASVLVLGATGNAGQLAVQVAKHLGAGRVVGAGRDAERLAGLPGLGADTTVALSGEPADVARQLGDAAGDVDIVLDYLWGPPTADAMVAVVTNRGESAGPLTWIEIGSVAGATAAIPSAALRAVPLQIVGSGQGSVATRDIQAELPGLAAAITDGTLRLEARSVPLEDVESAWGETNPVVRVVITP